MKHELKVDCKSIDARLKKHLVQISWVQLSLPSFSILSCFASGDDTILTCCEAQCLDCGAPCSALSSVAILEQYFPKMQCRLWIGRRQKDTSKPQQFLPNVHTLKNILISQFSHSCTIFLRQLKDYGIEVTAGYSYSFQSKQTRCLGFSYYEQWTFKSQTLPSCVLLLLTGTKSNCNPKYLNLLLEYYENQKRIQAKKTPTQKGLAIPHLVW